MWNRTGAGQAANIIFSLSLQNQNQNSFISTANKELWGPGMISIEVFESSSIASQHAQIQVHIRPLTWKPSHDIT